MIKSFEPVYKDIETLFLKKISDYIEKINIKYNDSLILQPFTNTKLEEKNIDAHSLPLN